MYFKGQSPNMASSCSSNIKLIKMRNARRVLRKLYKYDAMLGSLRPYKYVDIVGESLTLMDR